MKITRIDSLSCELGEGPVWDVVENALYGVDVLGRFVWRYDPATQDFRRWQFPELVMSLALRHAGGLVLAASSGLNLFDPATGALTHLADPCAGDPRHQLNDGKVDPAGRFIVGSVHTSGSVPGAVLFSLAADHAVRRLDDDYIVSNGPCWSPDGRVFYVADSTRHVINAYDYTAADGAIANRRVFATTEGGIPDGATVDAQGHVWTALCGGGRVQRYTPAGTLALEIPCPHLSCPASCLAAPRSTACS